VFHVPNVVVRFHDFELSESTTNFLFFGDHYPLGPGWIPQLGDLIPSTAPQNLVRSQVGLAYL
jgi:hypothetical protein